MVDGADAEGWTQVAAGWAELWGTFARPAQETLIARARVGPGTRVVDVGCGTGEFLALLQSAGADAIGVDPARGMRDAAAARGFTVRDGDAEALPLADATVDVVTAINALHFADDIPAALQEFARVLVPGGRVAVANWAEHDRNDIDVVERAITEADGEEPHTDGPLRAAGQLESAFAAAGVRMIASGIVEVPWRVPDADTLARGILLGEDQAGLDEFWPVAVEAAAPFADGNGGYLLRNSFRWAVGEV